MNADITNLVRRKKRELEVRIDLEKIQSGIDQYVPILSSTISPIKSESSLDFYDELGKLDYETFCLYLQVLKEGGYGIEAEWLKNSLPNPFQYKMKTESIGLCLIINNVKFSKKPLLFKEKGLSELRQGSEQDERVLKQVFENMGYKVVCKNNKTAEEMWEVLQYFSESYEDFNYDSLVTIISTHGNSVGNRDVLYGTDWKAIYKEDIYELFNNENCSYMQGKPKMFFFQACRGKQSYIRNQPIRYFVDALAYEQPEIHRPLFSFCNINPLPRLSDMIVVHSALPNHTCHRTKKGSTFCQALAKVLQRDYKKCDLNAMLVSVSEEMTDSLGREEFIHTEHFGPFGIVRFYNEH